MPGHAQPAGSGGGPGCLLWPSGLSQDEHLLLLWHVPGQRDEGREEQAAQRARETGRAGAEGVAQGEDQAQEATSDFIVLVFDIKRVSFPPLPPVPQK